MGGRTEAIVSGSPPGVEDLDLQLPDGVDHCYRHRDRETGVHCSNCGRAICYDCMTPAAVGFRCPECMAEQRRGTGRARVVTRQQTRSRWQTGRAGSGRFTVTNTLIALNVLMFLVELVTGAVTVMGGGDSVMLHRLGSLMPYDVIVNHEYWRMVSVMFLHGSIIHLLFNVWALYVIGGFVESLLGRVKFALLYLVAGLGGSALIVVATPLAQPTVGASGAIFGLFGALALYAYLFRHRDAMAGAILGQMVFLLVINLVFSFSGGVSWQGHIGGLVTGAAVMAGFCLLGRKRPGGPFTTSDVVTLVVALAAVIVVTLTQVVG
jgi:membrane associated rhomboid family serine protease